jgi:hypothetical protein
VETDTGDSTMSGDEDSAAYRFRGLPLTPNVIAELAPQLMTSEIFRRAELIEAVGTHHRTNGGAESDAVLAHATKKALATLQVAGVVEKTGAYGRWRWIDWDPNAKHVDPIEVVDAIDHEEVEDELLAGALIEGEGPGAVYAYYFDSYKLLAEADGRATWPIKIGMSSLGFRGRIGDQQGTAMPERPTIAYVFRSSTPGKVERLLHAVLFLRGRWLEDVPGSEWFDANPTMIRDIVQWAIHEPEGDSAPTALS